MLFDVSFALGAFFAGMVLAESELSQRAAQESLPLRDAFAVLFFVSVGMLFNPAILIDDPLPVLATLFIVVIGKSVAAYAIVRVFGHPRSTAALIAASLAQIGEFSFILATLGLEVGLLPEIGRDLIVTGAILSILLNPLAFLVADRLTPLIPKSAKPVPISANDMAETTRLSGHTILIGFGRVGCIVGTALKEKGAPLLVIEDDNQHAGQLAALGIEHIVGNGASSDVLEAANIGAAQLLLVAIPDGFEAGAIVMHARERNPNIRVGARAHSDEEVAYLKKHGADHVIMGEREIALGLLDYASKPEAA
jgi:CPA2 family monovalent cation:H+ antiporter-2